MPAKRQSCEISELLTKTRLSPSWKIDGIVKLALEVAL